jgi:type I restriction enzyme S subunit
MILELAVRGKLVAQDEGDEPASILLKKIHIEKEQLIKEKKIPKYESIEPIKLEEVPFELPNSWKWVRMADILTNISNGYSGIQSKSPPGIPLSRIETISTGVVDMSRVGYVQDISQDQIEKYRLYPHDILFSHINSDSHLGKTAIYTNDNLLIHGTNLLLIRIPKELVLANFVHIVMQSLRVKGYFVSIAQHAIHQSSINQTKIRNIIIPLPPLAEQQRIVNKLNQLMSLCDELEARQHKKRESRAHNSAALDRLLAARAPGEFAEGWRRISDNFDLLYDVPENVGALRQAILQLAVMGKLVEQDMNDESALVLMEKIKDEKERLIKEKKIKRTETLVEPSEVPFELPEGWNWVSMGNALLKVTDGTHHSPPNYETGDFKYVTAKNIKTQGIDLTNITYVSTAVHNEIYSRCNPEPGDILYIKDGATTGIATINNITEPFSMLSSVALLKMPSTIYNRYMHYVMRSPFFYTLMRDDMSGVAITRVTLTKLNKALIPLAPFKEQQRIVTRVDQLMSLCDKLEAGLLRSQADSERLMEAVVGRMLAE